jgi:hypothetical protein
MAPIFKKMICQIIDPKIIWINYLAFFDYTTLGMLTDKFKLHNMIFKEYIIR